MDKIRYGLCIFVFFADINSKLAAGKTTSYHFDKFEEEIKTDEKLFETNLDIKNSAPTEFIVNAEVNQLVELRNDSQISFLFNSADPEGDGSQYVELFQYPAMHLCDFMNADYLYLYSQFKNHSNIPDPSTCPVPPQKYTITNAPLSLEFLSKLLFPGKYRLDINLYRESKLLLTYRFYGRVVSE